MRSLRGNNHHLLSPFVDLNNCISGVSERRPWQTLRFERFPGWLVTTRASLFRRPPSHACHRWQSWNQHLCPWNPRSRVHISGRHSNVCTSLDRIAHLFVVILVLELCVHIVLVPTTVACITKCASRVGRQTCDGTDCSTRRTQGPKRVNKGKHARGPRVPDPQNKSFTHLG